MSVFNIAKTVMHSNHNYLACDMYTALWGRLVWHPDFSKFSTRVNVCQNVFIFCYKMIIIY